MWRSAPILDHDDRLVGIIVLLGAEQDIPTPVQPEQLRLVQGCAAAISAKLHATAYVLPCALVEGLSLQR